MRAFSAAGQSLVAMTASSWLITRSSDVLREHAATYSADLMLCEPPIDPTCIEAQRHRLRCVAALPVWHQLCEEEVIPPANASPYPFIALPRWQATNFRVDLALDDHRPRWNGAVEDGRGDGRESSGRYVVTWA